MADVKKTSTAKKAAPARKVAPAQKASTPSKTAAAAPSGDGYQGLDWTLYGHARPWIDGYEGLDWGLYHRVRPQSGHVGATGAGLVEYTLWLEVIKTRPAANRKDVPLPGQPVH